MRRTAQVAVLLLVAVAVSHGLVRAYSVEPASAQLSDWTDTLSQTLTINFDEPITASLFCGSRGDTGRYSIGIYSYPGGVTELAYNHGTQPPNDHSWLNCSLTVDFPDSFVKGRQVEVRWTRGGADSLEYYWSDGDPYKYGFMVTNQPHAGQDLAMRCLGRLNPVDSAYWSVDAFAFPWGEPQWYRDTWAVRAQEANLKAVRLSIEWKEFEKDPDSFDFGMLDDALQCIVNSAHCQVLGCLVSCPPWASTRTVIDSFSNPDTFVTPHAPPQNLFEPVSSDYNYYARYLRALLPHCDSVHTWEVSNEQNDSGPHCSDPRPGHYVEGWFHRPDRSFYPGVDTGLLGLCQLYMRLAAVTESVIRHDTFAGHESDRILLGGVFGATDNGPHLTPGWKWLDLCYEIAGNNVFWDGVAVHPYQSHNGLDPVLFEREAETLRAVMRQHGHAGAELWNT
jgi:hypothetical protein